MTNGNIVSGNYVGFLMDSKHVKKISASRVAAVDGFKRGEVAIKIEFTDGTACLSHLA